MLCKSTTGLPPNPYEIDHKNCSLVCMHLRLCPWAPLCAQRIILQSWFFFFYLHICWSFSLTPLYPDRAWVFFLAVFFKGSICVLSLKKKSQFYIAELRKCLQLFFLILFTERKKDYEVTEMSTFCKIPGTLRKYCVLYREQNSLKTELLDYGKHNSYGNEKVIHIKGSRPHTAP